MVRRGPVPFGINCHMRLIFNPAHRTDSGTHGGEMLATQPHINASDISPQIWDRIKGVSIVPLSISAKIITLHRKQYIIGVTYWNASQEPAKQSQCNHFTTIIHA